MGCNCIKSGQTKLASIMISGVQTETTQVYSLDMSHKLCGNRKLCINSMYQPSCSLNYTVQDIQLVGNNVYNCEVQVSGVLTYLPYGCGVCPVSESVFCNLSVPVISSTGIPTVALSGTAAIVSASGVKECTNLAYSVELESILTVNVTAPAK